MQSKGDGKPIEWDRRDTESAHSEKLDSLQLEVSEGYKEFLFIRVVVTM